jgi:serine/threonine protein kinase/ribosomal protein L22
MSTVRCPYCSESFDWSWKMGTGRVKCPSCQKAMNLTRRKGTSPGKTRNEVHRDSTAPGDTTMDTTMGTALGTGMGTALGTGAKAFGSAATSFNEISTGDELGGFRIEEMIGAGAMAAVYRATQLSLGRDVALKILPKDFAQKPRFVAQFDSETELLASLNHPNIVTIIDRGREGDTYYFAMELIEGTTLAEVSHDEMAADLDFFLTIFEQCARAIKYAHSLGIMHRDLKPANIMLNQHGMPKVADFGVAGLVAEAKSGKRRVVGTRGYMPPEQEVDIRKTDARSDIFSFGAVMYRMLTGRIPDDLPPMAPSKLRSNVDARLDPVILKCLHTNPDKRYQTISELLEALEHLHGALTKAQEVCPNCKKENPPSQMECLHCGHDLSDMFDDCPECGSLNRLDVALCMSCGAALARMRQEISVAISRAMEHARDYADRRKFELAIEELEQVLRVKGKMFAKARERAETTIGEYRRGEETYYLRKIREAKSAIENGYLDKALRTLKRVPEDVGHRHDVSTIVSDIQFRMMLSKKKVEGISGLLAEHKVQEAQNTLEQVAKTWRNCPGLDEARTQVKASCDADEMLRYELQEVMRLIREGKLNEAREAFEFADSAHPDHPFVIELGGVLAQREQTGAVRGGLHEGKLAFGEGRYGDAIRYWTMAKETLAEDDERRAAIETRITDARARLLKSGVAQLTKAEPLLLKRACSAKTEALLSVGACVGIGAVVAAAVLGILKLVS